MLASASRSQAQTFNTFFGATGGGGFTCSHPTNPPYCAGMTNNRPAPSILTVGDFWNQTINNSGLSSVSSLSLNLNLNNGIYGASSMQFSVLLNGVIIGNTPTYVTNGGNEINAPFTFTFGAISAATYDVKVRVSAATVPPGEQEGFGLFLDGPSTIQLKSSTTVPEPSTLAMTLIGLGVAGGLARRRTMRQRRLPARYSHDSVGE